MSDNPLDIYNDLGWDLSQEGSQLKGDCPFCGKSKMYVDPEKTTYSCKVCGSSGNNVTVMRQMFDDIYQPALEVEHLQLLADYRGMPRSLFKYENLGFDVVKNRVVFLVEKPNGMPASLRHWRAPKVEGKKASVRNIAGAKLGFMGGEQLGDKDRLGEPIYLCEGEWDFFAMRYLLRKCKEPGICLSAPGASNFPKAYIESFKDRNVVCLYDKDDAGRHGTVTVFKKIGGITKSLQFIHWDEKKKEGFDVHDLVKRFIEKPRTAFDYIKGNLQKSPTGTLDVKATGILARDHDREKEQESLEPIDNAELKRIFTKWLKWDNSDIIDIALACCWSVYLPGNPLWLFIVAPPSGSKSETIMPISEWFRAHAISNMTSRSLVSGFPGPGGSDPSLFAALNGKAAVLTVKDLTPLLQGRSEERDEVFGILRDAYDGQVTKVFGNGLVRSYDKLKFTILAGVTPAIDQNNGIALGERFLKFRCDKDTDRHDDLDRAMRALENTGSEDKMREELKNAVLRSLCRKFDPNKIAKATDDFNKYIAHLAYIVAHLRAVAPTERGTDNQTMAPMVEAPPRLAKQFIKFCQGIALHLESESLDTPRIRRLIKRVALHTPDAISIKISQALYYGHCQMGKVALDLMSSIKGLSRETVGKVLQRFQRLGVLEGKKTEAGMFYRYTNAFYKILKDTGIFDNLPQSDVFHMVPPKAKTIFKIKKRGTQWGHQ